jgi:hypothetical protein
MHHPKDCTGHCNAVGMEVGCAQKVAAIWIVWKDASVKLYTTNYWFVVLLLRRKVEMDRFYPGCCVCGDYSFDKKGYLVPTHTFARWRIKRRVPVASILICNNILEFCMDSYFPITYKLGAFHGKASHRHRCCVLPECCAEVLTNPTGKRLNDCCLATLKYTIAVHTSLASPALPNLTKPAKRNAKKS